MRRTGTLLALLLVILADAVVLAGVAWNRRGDAESSLALTERELPLAYAEKENTGMWLRVEVSGGGNRWAGFEDSSGEPPAWTRIERLAELGFDCSVPATDPSADLFYDKALPLERFAVLEYEGDAWRGWLARKEHEMEDFAREVEQGEKSPKELEDAMRWLERERIEASRLFLVDVGRDPADLRRRYSDRSRYIVMGAIVRLVLRRPWNKKTESPGVPILDAFAPDLLVDEIHVPHHMRLLLDRIRREDTARRESIVKSGGSVRVPEAPRYEVTLNHGRRHEPWIAGVRPLAPWPMESRQD